MIGIVSVLNPKKQKYCCSCGDGGIYPSVSSGVEYPSVNGGGGVYSSVSGF
jgi:hypothetical protein